MTRYEAHIDKGWQERGIANVMVLRHRPAGTVDVGFFLVDCWCLGVKNAWAEFDAPAAWVEDTVISRIPAEERERLHPACACKLIEGAIAYAEKLGFSPHRDYRKARKVLSGIDASLCPTDFTFGHNGKPCYAAGPDDSAERIDRVLAILEQRCGPDGFTYLIPGDEEDDLDEVREELIEWLSQEPASIPRFYQLSGLITAMQLCPQPLSPPALIEAVWGRAGRAWKDKEELLHFMDLLGGYWNFVSDLITVAIRPDSTPDDQIMDVWHDDFDSDDPTELIASLIEWSIGFMRATTLWPEAWRDALQRPDLAEHWEVLRWWADCIGNDNKDRIADAASAKPPRTIGQSTRALALALRRSAPAVT